jgi:hypothetical protein
MRTTTKVRSETVHSAFMLKKGGSRTNWLRRWFVLKGHELSYYDEKKQSQKGCVDMSKATGVRKSIAPTAGSNEFEIDTEERVWRIRADTPEEMFAWLEALGSHEIWLAGGPRYVGSETGSGSQFLRDSGWGSATELAADEDVERLPVSEPEPETEEGVPTQPEVDLRKSAKQQKQEKVQAHAALEQAKFWKKQAAWVKNAQAAGQGGFKLIGGPWKLGPGLHLDAKKNPKKQGRTAVPMPEQQQVCIGSKLMAGQGNRQQKFFADEAAERQFLLIHQGHEDSTFDPVAQVLPLDGCIIKHNDKSGMQRSDASEPKFPPHAFVFLRSL